MFEIPDPEFMPNHVAIIMDGNGRWASERGLPRVEGHRRGADVVRDITTFARELGIPYLTLFSFSVQNWKRPSDEVVALMALLEDYCRNELETLMENGIRLTTMGRLERLPESTRQAVETTVEATSNNDKMMLTLALDYGGREEIVGAVRDIAQQVAAGALAPDDIVETTLSSALAIEAKPDPELLIRTSGEQRISNFMLWQLAYTELLFSPVYWPDFSRQHFVEALDDFSRRQRRFGATSAQVEDSRNDLYESPLLQAKGSGTC